MPLKELDLIEWSKVSHLFASHFLSKSVIHPCINTGIGTLEVDDRETPSVALYSIPLMKFLAGDSSSTAAVDMIKMLPSLTILIPIDEGWSGPLKTQWKNQLVINERTHLDHTSLRLDHLRDLKDKLSGDFTLKEFNLGIASQIDSDYKMQIQLYFRTLRNFIEKGIGFGILHDEKLVSYAYTPFPFIDEFEIQVFTIDFPEYRRKGLATVAAAALIEYGLKNCLIPHWDAANEPSFRLALKLGYCNPKKWEAYYYKKQEA